MGAPVRVRSAPRRRSLRTAQETRTLRERFSFNCASGLLLIPTEACFDGDPGKRQQKGVSDVLRWYDFKNKNGATITIKGRFEAEAKQEAAERWNCDAEDLICTGHTPYNSRQVPFFQFPNNLGG